MNTKAALRFGIPVVLACLMAPTIVSAQSGSPAICSGSTGPGKGMITIPNDLCCYDEQVPENLAIRLMRRDDFGLILQYMTLRCPELALALSDFATATVTPEVVSEDGKTFCESANCPPEDDSSAKEEDGEEEVAEEEDEEKEEDNEEEEAMDESGEGECADVAEESLDCPEDI